MISVSSDRPLTWMVFSVSPLLRRERGTGQQLGHADHAVHRRADLVADVGQELALGAVGGHGLVAGLLEVAGALPHLVLQAESQAVELVVDAPEAAGERDAHGHDHGREAEGRHGKVERPRQAEDVARQLDCLDGDHDQRRRPR